MHYTFTMRTGGVPEYINVHVINLNAVMGTSTIKEYGAVAIGGHYHDESAHARPIPIMPKITLTHTPALGTESTAFYTLNMGGASVRRCHPDSRAGIGDSVDS